MASGRMIGWGGGALRMFRRVLRAARVGNSVFEHQGKNPEVERGIREGAQMVIISHISMVYREIEQGSDALIS